MLSARREAGVPRVLFWVQHLLGTGHLERMRRIAEALAARGVDVHFVSGGVPLAGRMPIGVKLVQLPPVKVADASFTPLRDAEGAPIDETFRRDRAQRLLDAFDAAAPSVVLFETFPFGRRSLRFELMPLLEHIDAARPRPRVLSSIRDILQLQEKAGRDAESWAWAKRWFDEVLVHGDPSFVRLEETFPLAADGDVPIFYTGYVTSPGEPLTRALLTEQQEIVVSAGGGATGTHVLHAAIAARPHSAHRHLRWRVLVGPGIAEEEFRALRAKTGDGVVVERNRLDFPELLSRARVSVSQGGLQHDDGRAAQPRARGRGAIRGAQRIRAADAHATACRPRCGRTRRASTSSRRFRWRTPSIAPRCRARQPRRRSTCRARNAARNGSSN